MMLITKESEVSQIRKTFPILGRLIIVTYMAKFVDQEFIQYIVASIVDHPDDVKVNRTVDEMGVLLTVDVNTEDVGSVVGREGQTIKAIRLLGKIVGAKNKSRVNIKLNQPDRPDRPARFERTERNERAPKASSDSDLDLDI